MTRAALGFARTYGAAISDEIKFANTCKHSIYLHIVYICLYMEQEPGRLLVVQERLNNPFSSPFRWI